MTDNKHTPGPWIWGKNYHGLYGAGPDNVVLAHASYEGMWLSFGRQEANGNLIAASPDLLAAVQLLIRCGQKQGWMDAYAQEMHFALNAVAKAEGRTTPPKD